MFVDRVEINVKAGNGGNGAVAFRREKYVPNGGPDGGDGGRGASVILKVDAAMRTLMDFRYKKNFVGDNGEDGMGKSCYGKAANDLIIKVPQGTIVKDMKTDAIIADLVEIDSEFIVAKGGRGGRGNKHFKTPTRQAPAFAEAGYKGQERQICLELKSLADVGLIGYPSVGKSTILAISTKAKPKIADYHFTTLYPNLGVAEFVRGKSFTIADIPGLIEGASEGLGLGYDFLRHIERTRLLLHIVDISASEGRNPKEDFEKINFELKNYNEELSRREMIVIGNKFDLIHVDEIFDESDIDDELMAKILQAREFKNYVEKSGYKYFEISAAENTGVEALMKYVTTRLDEIPMPEPIIINELEYIEKSTENFEIKVEKISDGEFRLSGEGLERLVYATDFDSYQGVKFFENYLKRRGIMDELKEMGLQNGDSIEIQGYIMEYME